MIEENTMFSLDGKTALVTGGSRGLGEAFAKGLANAGAKVVIADILEDEGKATAAANNNAGGTAIFQRLDVSKEDNWQAVLAHTKEEFGGLNILINNAGIIGEGTILDATLEDWNHVLDINLTGVF